MSPVLLCPQLEASVSGLSVSASPLVALQVVDIFVVPKVTVVVVISFVCCQQQQQGLLLELFFVAESRCGLQSGYFVVSYFVDEVGVTVVVSAELVAAVVGY